MAFTEFKVRKFKAKELNLDTEDKLDFFTHEVNHQNLTQDFLTSPKEPKKALIL